VKLAEAAALRSVDDGRPLVTLPAGGAVIPLRVDDDEALVVWRGRPEGTVGPDPQQVLFGVVEKRALASVSAARVNAVVEGVVHPAENDGPLPRPIIVQAKWAYGAVTLRAQGSVAADGAFRLIAPVNQAHPSIWVEGTDGRALSDHEYPATEAGKTVRADLTMRAPER
jgi:hypothetical protein